MKAATPMKVKGNSEFGKLLVMGGEFLKILGITVSHFYAVTA
jgi:hypothetical protein